MNANIVKLEKQKTIIIAMNVIDVQKYKKNSVSIVIFVTSTIQAFNLTITIAANATFATKNQLKIYFTVINARGAYLRMKTTIFIADRVLPALQEVKKIHIIAKYVKIVILIINNLIVIIVDNAIKLNINLSIYNVNRIAFQDVQLVQGR